MIKMANKYCGLEDKIKAAFIAGAEWLLDETKSGQGIEGVEDAAAEYAELKAVSYDSLGYSGFLGKNTPIAPVDLLVGEECNTTYNVVLGSSGDRKINVIKALRSLSNG